MKVTGIHIQVAFTESASAALETGSESGGVGVDSRDGGGQLAGAFEEQALGRTVGTPDFGVGVETVFLRERGVGLEPGTEFVALGKQIVQHRALTAAVLHRGRHRTFAAADVPLDPLCVAVDIGGLELVERAAQTPVAAAVNKLAARKRRMWTVTALKPELSL